MALSKCHEPHERNKEIFIATKGEIAPTPKRSKTPEREMTPRSLAHETPEAHTSEQENHRSALFRWHSIDRYRLYFVLFTVNILPPLKF